MTDREMLELAAKAAGLNFTWDEGRVRVEGSGFTGHNPNWRYWNPLTDDGDALRLAVKLRLRFWHDGSCANVYAPTSNRYCWTEKAVVEANDHDAATRLAITRAAAEIGRNMP